MSKLKTSLIVAMSLAVGTIGGAAVTAYAAQPNMEAALNHLIQADMFLRRATANKAGHRAKAISLVNAAIYETRLGIRAGEF